MKRLLYLLLATLPLNASADDGGFATASEFGAPRLELSAPAPKLKTPLRQWHVAAERPFLAQLTGISGSWGKNATISLRTPTGRTLNIPAQHLSDDDLDSVRAYMKAEGFVQLHTYLYGTLEVKLLSVRRLSKEELALEVLALDGTRQFLRANAEPWQEEYARKVQFNKTIVMQEETRNMLLQHMNQHAQTPAPASPLPVAESAMEALTYAALHDVSVVFIMMGPRGCEADANFRRYLREHPEAASIWAQHYVFLVAYADSNNTIPTTCYEDFLQLCHHHNRKDALYNLLGNTDWKHHHISQSLCGVKFTLHMTDVLRRQSPHAGWSTFAYKREALQMTLPQHINFER